MGHRTWIPWWPWDLRHHLYILWQNYLNEKYGKKLNYGNWVDQLAESLNILKEKDGLEYAKCTKTFEDWETEYLKNNNS